MRTTAVLCAVSLAILANATAAAATPVLHVSAGILTGASGVNVNGTLYDVTFSEGTCAAAYDGCNEMSDFTFTSEAAARAASMALLSQVLVDGPRGNFDSVPSLTFGCAANVQQCSIFTPYAAGAFVPAIMAVNNQLALGDILGTASIQPGHIFSDFRQFTLADWSLTPAGVPEPASMTLLLAGVLGVGAGYWQAARRTTHDG